MILLFRSPSSSYFQMILERGEKLELLVDKTDQLQSQAFQFQKTSRKLKDAMWWRKAKTYALMAFAVLFVAWMISAFACGIDYSKCRNDEGK
jgi:vesicle-associated membrane protein 7